MTKLLDVDIITARIEYSKESRRRNRPKSLVKDIICESSKPTEEHKYLRSLAHLHVNSGNPESYFLKDMVELFKIANAAKRLRKIILLKKIKQYGSYKKR